MSLIGKDVIGFDEFGNGGLALNRLPRQYVHAGRKFPLVVVGYLNRNYSHSQYGTERCGSKRSRGFFGAVTNIQDILRYSRVFLSEHPDFFYSVVHQEELRKGYALSRSKAIVTLTLRFLHDYFLNPENTAVLIHDINGTENSEVINNQVNAWLKIFSLPMESSIKSSKSQRRSPSLKSADTIAYYLGALKFFGGYEHWPFRSRKTDLSTMMDYVTQLDLI